MAYGVEAFVLRTNKRHWYPAYSELESGNTDTHASVLTSAPSGGSGYVNTESANVAKVMVYGNGSEDFQIITRLYTYSPCQISPSECWVPTFVAKLTWTLSDATVEGPATDSLVTDGDTFCDVVELNDGDTSIRLVTDTEDNGASVTVDLEGGSYLLVAFDETGLSVMSAYNALVGKF